jgi:hypothetical protein
MVASASSAAVTASTAQPEGDGKTRDFGELSMTNNYELLVTVNKNTTCLIVPKILDRKNLQLTLSLQTKNAAGAIQGMNMTQVTGPQGKPFEVAIGDVDLTLLPVVTVDN